METMNKLEFAALLKDVLKANGYYTAPTVLADETTRVLSVYLEKGKECPVASVVKYIIDHQEDTDPQAVVSTLYIIAEAFSSAEFTSQKRVMFWRSIPWTA